MTTAVKIRSAIEAMAPRAKGSIVDAVCTYLANELSSDEELVHFLAQACVESAGVRTFKE